MNKFFALVWFLSSMHAAACEPEKEPVPKVKKGEEALPGYWAGDEEFIYEMMLADMAKFIEAGTVTKEKLKADAAKYSKMMLFQFSADKTSMMHTVSGDRKATFEITAKRPAKNEMDVMVTSGEDVVEKTILVVIGDSLTMKAEGGGGSVRLKRVSKIEAEKRKAHIKSLREKK